VSMHHSIIRSPSITEKNTVLRTNQNKYVFEVAPQSTKQQVKKAVEQLFSVKVVSVNTMVVKGKYKKMGRFAGYKSNWKKAIVKVAKGQSIAKFGEV
jgi:large subunit ribosomal protein L23